MKGAPTPQARPIGRPRRALVAAAACAAALAAAGSALADAIQVHYTAADQAAARREVLRAADLGAGWKGGSTRPDVSSDTGCARFDPRQSDLVVTGAAAVTFRNAAVVIQSETHLLRTARMVELDWQRTVVAPQVLPCLREVAARQAASQNMRLVSARWFSFPRVAPRTAAFRTLLDVTSGTATVRVLVDVVVLGKGRSELTLITTAPAAARPQVQAAEVRLARLLAARAAA